MGIGERELRKMGRDEKDGKGRWEKLKGKGNIR